jgi:hypothetical protein
MNKNLIKKEDNNDDESPFLEWTNLYYGEIDNAETNSQNKSCSIINYNHYYEKTIWYFISKPNYIVGYNKETCRIESYIGSNGFSKSLHDIKPFTKITAISKRYEPTQYILNKEFLYIINLDQKKVIPIKLNLTEKIISINCEPQIFNRTSYKTPATPIVIETENRIIRYNANGEVLSELLLPEKLKKNDSNSYLFINDTHYLKYTELDEKTGVISTRAKAFSSNGEVVWEYNEPIMKKDDFHSSANSITRTDINNSFLPSSVILSINVLSRIYEVDTSRKNSNPFQDKEFRELGTINGVFWFTFIILFSCLIFVYFHLKREQIRN